LNDTTEEAQTEEEDVKPPSGEQMGFEDDDQLYGDGDY
jgi:hypothetical protein